MKRALVKSKFQVIAGSFTPNFISNFEITNEIVNSHLEKLD